MEDFWVTRALIQFKNLIKFDLKDVLPKINPKRFELREKTKNTLFMKIQY